MRVETRIFKSKKFLLLICESEQESAALDLIVGKIMPVQITGTRDLADGYGEDYIRIEGKML